MPIVYGSRYDCRYHPVHFCLLNVQSEGAFVSRSANRSIAAKPGKLEHQHIGNTILAGFDVIHRFAKGSTAFNGFPRFSGILIFTDDLVVVDVCIAIRFIPVSSRFAECPCNPKGAVL